MPERGKYIVLEGLDGCGKTTQYQRILDSLGDTAIGVREPGGTPTGERMREIVKTSFPRSARTNAYLFSAARAALVEEVIRPAINSGLHVISDRHWLSTIAYQTAEGLQNLDEIVRLSRLATREFFAPDLLILIDTDVEVCHQRLIARGGSADEYFETKGSAYFEKVRGSYLTHIDMLPTYEILDGNRNVDTIGHDIAQLITVVIESDR